MNNFFIIILDGVGIGELPDAANYGDTGSNTLVNIATAVDGLKLPNLEKLGLGNIERIKGITEQTNPLASYGKMKEISKGKDSTTGHWEISGLYVDTDFSYFPNGFTKEIMDNFLKKTGCKGYLGNKAASGTEIIKELGEEHVKTGFPIVYTSADSVFQIAAHEKVISLERQYEICSITRNEVLVSPLMIGRVIARPFIGEPGNFKRTTNRKDFSLDPPSRTVLNILSEAGIKTVAIGKINDLFNYNGIDIREKTKSNEEGCVKLLEYSKKGNNNFIFTNLVDFDVYFGHRNDPEGFAKKLAAFDSFLPEFLGNLDETDRVLITADHGNDPTTPSTDHSREYVPLLFYSKNKRGKNLGIRQTFSDAGKTVADFFGVDNDLKGKSFLNE
ncbi:phosphopentomutase [bacterium BMS3Abin03]|jgi:phosphopentomutase|nr:phosphopentomutase [bacterium BMS3Abin03]MCG6960195.1 phosphopentomutase [bacterium BMS3Abin03]